MATAMTKPERRETRSWRFDPIGSLREELDSVLSRLTTERPETWIFGTSVPPCDVTETAGELRLKFDLPGMKADDIEVQLHGNVLTVSGERKEEKEEKGQLCHRLERRHGAFSRTITLPCAVVEDKVDAKYRDGVLCLTIPKTEEARSRKIKVQA